MKILLNLSVAVLITLFSGLLVEGYATTYEYQRVPMSYIDGQTTSRDLWRQMFVQPVVIQDDAQNRDSVRYVPDNNTWYNDIKRNNKDEQSRYYGL